MSIQDDYFDLEDHLKNSNLEEAFERFSSFTFELEKRVKELTKEKNELAISLKTVLTNLGEM